MARTDGTTKPGRRQGLGATATSLVTAALLLLAVFAVGVNSNGTRAGLIEALAVLAAAATFGRAAYTGRLPRPLNVSLGLMLLALLAGLAALSVSWSLLPGASLLDSLRLVSYVCVLAIAGLWAQTRPQRARDVALGIALAALIVISYSLLSRCFPGIYPQGDDFARLRLPFGYWNAVGSVAAIGLVIALWAGTTRLGSGWVEIASYPAGGLLASGLMLSGSRGALLALLVGVGAWLLLVPRRLRSACWLGVVGALTGILVAWAYSSPQLTTDGLPLAERESIGLQLFAGLLALCLALTAAGLMIRGLRRTHHLDARQRHRAGAVLLTLLACSPLLLVGVLAAGNERGLTGVASSAGGVFDNSAAAPSNSPSRLTQTSSLRGRYWSESWTVFRAHTLHGTGADTFSTARLPHRPDALTASHAHGMVPQTGADLGLLGLVVLLALTVVWISAALRLAGAGWRAPWRWLEAAEEQRLASVAMMVAALVFGVHSALDWIWFLPGVAFFGLACGGWTLGTPEAHGASVTADEAAPSTPSRGLQMAQAAGILIVGLAVAWGVYQPVRASQKVDEGLTLAQADPASAAFLAKQAIALDPTSARARMLLAAAQSNAGQTEQAHDTLLALVTLQPNNPAAWLRLASFRLTTLRDPDGAAEALGFFSRISRFDPAGEALLEAARRAQRDAT